jgi:hypothetical protein
VQRKKSRDVERRTKVEKREREKQTRVKERESERIQANEVKEKVFSSNS